MDWLDQLEELSTRDWESSDTAGTVRFAMIGCGWWTVDAAIPAVRDADYCETTVVVSGDREKAERTAGTADSIEHALTYDEFHDGAASDSYDAVYVCTPNALHLPYVETAVDLGKAILCEKPMESTPERAAELVDVAEGGSEPLMVGYRMHTEPAVRRARDVLESGAIGEPILVGGNMSQPLLDVIPDHDQWRLDPDLSGGTTLMDIGLYPLNTARFVLGRDPVRGRATTKYTQEPFADTGDEHVAFSLDFPDDVTASCTASYGAYKASHLRVVGTEGELLLEPAFYPDEDRKLRISQGRASAEVDFDQVNEMLEEFDYFAHCLLTGEEPHADGRHGLTDVRIMDGLYEAAADDTVVEFDL